MLQIEYSENATEQLNEIIENPSIYNNGHFTQLYINWNSEFYRYVNPKSIGESYLTKYGWYKIGGIGVFDYKYTRINDRCVIEILEFRFSKLPYQQKKQQYTIIGDAGYKYKIIQSIFNHKCSILTPQRKRLTKFVFDQIIGFHHSSNDYNTIYATGFQGDRVFAIYQDGNIKVLPYSKEEYLNKKHKYYESHKPHKKVITESHIRQMVRETLRRYLQL
jgi:hypothetical protein